MSNPSKYHVSNPGNTAKNGTVIVQGYFGDKEVTRREFIALWVDQAKSMQALSYSVEWEKISKRLIAHTTIEAHERFNELVKHQTSASFKAKLCEAA